MNITPEYVEYLVEMAREIETSDPIDWGMLNISEDEAYRLMALNVLEMMLPKYNDPSMRDVLMATIIKLVVENFTLNLKLLQRT